MTQEEVNELASELVREWIKRGPDTDFVSEFFDGELDADSLGKIHAESAVLARGLTYPED
ncbi:hypothetical protein [Mycobacteroides chelonae]|uniref:hypothetical protein n=1 Tax=Mycobacteroides chelonae TaxID=1774 RepID=UPI0008A8AE82|nr:hypothetical protein [Mycobacteroides chelonae]OHT73361.1 hypothetical protein BKG66_07895 [Mycobacteroides chelonae]OHT75953.1 hypothetical protein BKG67_04950 [Mycobacteroides chelonae]